MIGSDAPAADLWRRANVIAASTPPVNANQTRPRRALAQWCDNPRPTITANKNRFRQDASTRMSSAQPSFRTGPAGWRGHDGVGRTRGKRSIDGSRSSPGPARRRSQPDANRRRRSRVTDSGDGEQTNDRGPTKQGTERPDTRQRPGAPTSARALYDTSSPTRDRNESDHRGCARPRRVEPERNE